MTELVVSHLSHIFPDTGRGCSNVSFTASAPQLTVLAGESGAGKSTALATIAHILHPQTGTVTLSGKPVSTTDVSLVFQGALAFNRLRAWENVALSWGYPSKHTKARAVKVLAGFALEDTADSRPDQLSGGQRQRLAIACALTQDRPILLLDEPTSHLDDKNAALVITTIHEAAAQRIVVVASHDRRLTAVADHTVVIERLSANA